MATSTRRIFSLVEVADTRSIKGVLVPSTVGFRQILVTGPSCSGKSTLVKKLGGWPEEGYIDLGLKKWWQSSILTFRPREIHFGFPFVGFEESHTVFDREWLQSPADIEFSRVQLPPRKRGIFSLDWRNRYAFDFQLPPAEQIYSISQERNKRGTHPIDAHLTLARIKRALEVYERLALFFHNNGMLVYIRDHFDGYPKTIAASDSADAG
ncbi:MAG: serine/threonine protein phosphatase [Gammaproteobacteria bacterium]|nr:serine/threonine protein phosphatase [Gammaproteobacteria bacterium]